jgi:hypothetical protein
MKNVYITFDRYYKADTYNSFKIAAKNNGIEFEEYIKIRPPYLRYLKINNKKDLPAFVNYDFATSSEIKWLVSTIKAVQPNQEYLLRRREGKDISYWNYILQEPMKNAHKEDYMIVFKSNDFTEMSQISRKLGDTMIYKWGKAKIKGYNIYYCFNPYIQGIVESRNVLLHYGKDLTSSYALKTESQVPKVKGDIEFHLNYYVLVKEKLENKTLEAEYWLDGKIHPLPRETFI